MMKVSQNLYADTLLKALGAVNGTGTVTAGRDAVIARCATGRSTSGRS
jgi:D-alanyl-D-alanine carboxypeptidase